MNDEQKAKLAERLATLNLEYTAVFVPQSASRNSAEERPTLNWRVTIERPQDPRRGCRHSPPIATDYQQGIGHVPGIPQTWGRGETREVREHRQLCEAAAESGKYPKDGVRLNSVLGPRLVPLPAPPLADVLYSLLLEGDAADQTFEEWCDNYGYDVDSRTAEKTYNACRDMGQKLQRMFTRAELEELRELFQDY